MQLTVQIFEYLVENGDKFAAKSHMNIVDPLASLALTTLEYEDVLKCNASKHYHAKSSSPH
jgi:hypothetical protein